MYTHTVDSSRLRAEQLLTLSSAARRIGDLVSVAEAPVHYEVLRHLLRVSEETMTEVLEEAVAAGLVARAEDPFRYVPAEPCTGAAIAESIDAARTARLRAQIARATADVIGD